MILSQISPLSAFRRVELCSLNHHNNDETKKEKYSFSLARAVQEIMQIQTLLFLLE